MEAEFSIFAYWVFTTFRPRFNQHSNRPNGTEFPLRTSPEDVPTSAEFDLVIPTFRIANADKMVVVVNNCKFTSTP